MTNTKTLNKNGNHSKIIIKQKSLIQKLTFFELCIIFFDFILFSLFIFFIIQDIYYRISTNMDLFNFLLKIDLKLYTMDSDNTINMGTTNTTIIHSNEGWASGIKSIFIYGTGAFRLILLRSGGSPVQRSFVIITTLLLDAVSTVFKNAINDRNYIWKHLLSWKKIWLGSSTLQTNAAQEPLTASTIVNSSTKIQLNNYDFSEIFTNWVIEHLKLIFEPICINFSTEMLPNHIYGISVFLFIIFITLLILLFAFIINIIFYLYSGKIKNYFSNKYIR